jgi:hypothetical protein
MPLVLFGTHNSMPLVLFGTTGHLLTPSPFLGAPLGCPFVEDRRVSDHYIHFHFLHFARAYSADACNDAQLRICRLHLQVRPGMLLANWS